MIYKWKQVVNRLLKIFNEVEIVNVPLDWIKDSKLNSLKNEQGNIPQHRFLNPAIIDVKEVICCFKTLIHQQWLIDGVASAITSGSFHPDGEANLDASTYYKLRSFFQWWVIYHDMEVVDSDGIVCTQDIEILSNCNYLAAILYLQGDNYYTEGDALERSLRDIGYCLTNRYNKKIVAT